MSVAEHRSEENGKEIRSIDDSDSDTSREQRNFDQLRRKKWTSPKKDPLIGAIRVLPGLIEFGNLPKNGNCHLVKPSEMLLHTSSKQQPEMSEHVIRPKFKCASQVMKGEHASIASSNVYHESPCNFPGQQITDIPIPMSRKSILCKQQQQQQQQPKYSLLPSTSKSLSCINENSELKTSALSYQNRAPSSIINPIWQGEQIYSLPNQVNPMNQSVEMPVTPSYQVNRCSAYANEKSAPKSLSKFRSYSSYDADTCNELNLVRCDLPPNGKNGESTQSFAKMQFFSDFIKSTEEIRVLDPRTGRSSLTKSTEEISINKWLQQGPNEAEEITDERFEKTVERADQSNGDGNQVAPSSHPPKWKRENEKVTTSASSSPGPRTTSAASNSTGLKASESVDRRKSAKMGSECADVARSKDALVRSSQNFSRASHSAVDSPNSCSESSDGLIGRFKDPSIGEMRPFRSIQPLSESNYATWSKEMSSFLKSKNLFKFIESENELLKKHLATAKGKKANESTMAIISAKVDEKIYGQIVASSKTAKELWQALKSVQLNLYDKIQIEESKEECIEDSISHDLSHYDAEFYLLGRMNLKNEIYELTREIESLRDELKKNQEMITNFKETCQICGDKKHPALKCTMFKDRAKNEACTIC